MAEEKKPWSVPPSVLVWGGLAAVALVFGKQLLDWASGFLKSLHKDPSITPTGEPTMPALDTFRVRAKFIEPANNGHLASSLVPFAMIKMKIELNNPEAQARTVSLVVEVEWFPRTFYGGEKSKTNATRQLLAPVGRSTHIVEVARPVTVAVEIDAVASASVDGMQTSSVAFVVD